MNVKSMLRSQRYRFAGLFVQHVLFPLPDPASLGSVVSKLNEAGQMLSGIQTSGIANMFYDSKAEVASKNGALYDHCGYLRHGLPKIKHKDPKVFRSSTKLEERVAKYIYPKIVAAIDCESPEDFIQALELANNLLERRSKGLRDRPFKDKRFLRTPSFEYTPARLSELHGYIRMHMHTCPLLIMAVSMVVITNLHPFWNGNGRTSRVLGNILLRMSGIVPNGYVPFYEIFLCSNGAWLIRGRLAELSDNWVPISNYLISLPRVIEAIVNDPHLLGPNKHQQ